MRLRWDAYWAEAIEPRLFLMRHLSIAGPSLVGSMTAVNLVLGLLPVAFVVATSVLVGRVPAAVDGGLGSPAWDDLVVAFLFATAAFAAQQILTPVQTSMRSVLKHRVDGHFHDRLIEVCLRSTGIGPLEDQQNLESLREASEALETGFRTPGDACGGMLALVARYTRLAGFGVVVSLATFWWAGIVICGSVMVFRYGHRGGIRMYMRVWPKVVHHRRERGYFRDIGLGGAAAKELRVFGLTEWVVGRYRSSALAGLAPLWRDRRRVNAGLFIWITALGLVLSSIVVVAMLRAATEGELTLTQLSLGLQATVAAILLGEFFHEADPATQFGMHAVRALDDFEERVAAAQQLEDTTGRDAAGLPRRAITFQDVAFSYPGSSRPVYEHLDLELRAGECTAIVGLNGAGKTTLVKLLARLHEPTSGTLLVDGQDARSLSVESWRRQIGVIFQDFNRYELSVADNIAFGAVHRPFDRAEVEDAARKAGLGPAIAALPHGLDTRLGRSYIDGADLSGGQWQRVAIARALYAVAGGARVLVLDEPTAALDVRAEAAFFEEFRTLTQGVTTLLISHRFSSVRRADRIVVLEQGRVVEDGSHDGLLARGGRYAELFTLQAERFESMPDAGPTALGAYS